MATKPTFEHKTCTRCGGSGQYSFNLMHGSTCYGCGGRGWTYTKRGAAAAEYYNELLTVDWTEVTVGMKIWEDSPWRRGWRTVVSVDLDRKMITVAGDECQWSFADERSIKTLRRKPVDNEEWAEIKEKALAYQETLTKAGTPRKR